MDHWNWVVARGLLGRLVLEFGVNDLLASSITPAKLRAAGLRAYGLSLAPSARISQRVRFTGRNITVGDNSHVNDGVLMDEGTTLGARVNVGPRAMFIARTHNIGDHTCRRVGNVIRPITVEDGCWIGAGAIVLPGVTVGEGCVVAAGAVVARDCSPDGLYAGVPAVRIRDLPSRAGTAFEPPVPAALPTDLR